MKRIFRIFMLALLALTVCAVMVSCGNSSSGTGSTENTGASESTDSTESTGNPSTPNKPVNEEAFTSATVTETNTDGRADAEITELSVGFLTEEIYNNGSYTEDAITKTTYVSTLSASYMVIDFKIKTLENIENKSVKVMARVSDGLGMTVIVEDAPTGKVEPIDNPDGSKSYDLIYSLPEAAGTEKAVRMILKVLPYAGGEVSVDVSVTGIDGSTVKGKTTASTPFVAPSRNLKFELKDGAYSVRGTEDLTIPRLFIPSAYEGVSVTSMGDALFDSCTILSITIPNSVTSVGNLSFNYCTNLTSVTLPESVTSMGRFSFKGCVGLTDIAIPAGVTSIGNYAFEDCTGLMNITLPDSLTSIGDGVFRYCENLTGIALPDGLKGLGYYVFSGCSGLTDITVPDSVTKIGNSAFSGCDSLTAITLPFVGESADGTSNTHFGYIFGAERYYDVEYYVPQSLKTVVITGGSQIGGNAFYGCSGLTGITLPDTLTSIGNSAFSKCSGLTDIAIPNSVTSIGDEAFFQCKGMSDITISASVTSIGSKVFAYCENLKTVTLPNSVTSIGSSAFESCKSLTDITIQGGVMSIDNHAFDYCVSLTDISVSENNPYYCSEDGVLFNKEKTELICCPKGKTGTYTIHDGVTGIGENAFFSCESLSGITIPDSVTSIGYAAFQYCHSLTAITVPAGVTSIGDSAFTYCDSLTDISVSENNANYSSEDGVLFNKEKTNLICYPKGKTGTYTIPTGVKNVGKQAFYNRIGLTAITIPDSVTSIADYGFYGCTGLTSIQFLGTTARWKSISLGALWNLNTGVNTVTCTNGTVTLS